MRTGILIATHERWYITSWNINLLLLQRPKPLITIVVSDVMEKKFYEKKEINVILSKANTLGKKWQDGVDYMRNIKISSLIITGSDDILHKNFTFLASKYLKNYDFIALKRWYVFDNENNLYLFNYNTDRPLGGGRIYSKKLLDIINWNLFNVTRSVCLDNQGWEIINNLKEIKKTILSEPLILAVKGDWKMLNPLIVHFNHPNTTLLHKFVGKQAKKILNKNFGYGTT